MQPLFDITKLNDYARTDKLPFECEYCSQTFYMEAKWIRLRLLKHQETRFCSTKCMGLSQITSINVNCVQCGITFIKQLHQFKLSKSGNSFCSHSCAATYNNTHKTTGTRRSKLEQWLEEKISISYPSLHVKYNQKETINSELDIYIPSLNLAFELNGIFHYEPIYGQDKLASIQNNDSRKFQACLEKNIELVIIDTSSLKRFKSSNAEKFWEIIQNIINIKLGTDGGTQTHMYSINLSSG